MSAYGIRPTKPMAWIKAIPDDLGLAFEVARRYLVEQPFSTNGGRAESRERALSRGAAIRTLARTPRS